MPSILLIDDDDNLREYLHGELQARGHTVESLDCAERGLDCVVAVRYDVVVLDNKMPRITGLEFLAEIRSRKIAVPVILMTASPTTGTAIRATALGAFKYIIKPPLDRKALAAVLQAEIEAEMQRARASALMPNARFTPRDSSEALGEHVLVGNSKSMLEVYTRISRAASTSDPVLILGETGTGKELVARAIHDFSPRKDMPFVAVNTGAINANLADSHLFGHRKGSFTGADRDHAGCFERADGGTLFLDEIGDMPLDLQVKCLRVLQEGRFERVGGPEIKVNVRVLAATHCDLPRMVRDGKFREDLHERLYCFDIRLPPLRERLEDLPDLIHCFLEQEAVKTGRRLEIAEAALERLRGYHWPRNVRQLKNVMVKAIALCQGSQILPHHVEFPDDGATSTPDSEDEALAGLNKAIAWALAKGKPKVWDTLHELLERELVAVALQQCGNKKAAAERLGVAWNTVSKYLKEQKPRD